MKLRSGKESNPALAATESVAETLFDADEMIIISTIKNYLNQNEMGSQVEQKKTIVELVEYMTTQPKFLTDYPRFRDSCITKMNELCDNPLALSIRPILHKFRVFVNGLAPIHQIAVGDSVTKKNDEKEEEYDISHLQWDHYNDDGTSHWIYSDPSEYK
jgi:hypothetical protein